MFRRVLRDLPCPDLCQIAITGERSVTVVGEFAVFEPCDELEEKLSMSPRTLAVGAIAFTLVLVSIALLLPADGPPPRDAPTASDTSATDSPPPSPQPPARADSASAQPPKTAITVAEAEQTAALARSSHAEALAAFDDAQNKLADVEHELAAVERFVDDLVQRGDDPAKHAFEGMERLNPVIERFEERVLAVEHAEERTLETQRALDAAEDQLETLRARSR